VVAAPVVVVAVPSAVVRALLSTFFAGEVLAGAVEAVVDRTGSFTHFNLSKETAT
jgi:diacylglycerol kinase